jgi:hypothetical protein
MALVAYDTVFLAFSLDRFLRKLPLWLGVLLFLGLFLVIVGIVYLYNYLKALSTIRKAEEELADDAGTSQEKMANLQKKMTGKRGEIEQKREARLKEIPDGPIEDNDLPSATVRIRNRVEKISSGAEFAIGKAPDNDLVVAELGISRRHAKIRPEKGGYVVYDLVSTRGTYVNGQKVTKRVLRDGDEIRIGPDPIIFNLGK